jgi:MinD-like ATPase involved in chromosome partitioning or flagellar assembly
MMGEVLSFVSVKGGVGKTTLSLEVASSLVNRFGKRVLLVDANVSAPNIGLYLDLTVDKGLHDVLEGFDVQHAVHEVFGVDVLPARLNASGVFDVDSLRRLLSSVRSKYDFVILDSSPYHEELKPVISSSDRVFVVTSPDRVTLHTSLLASSIARAKRVPIEGLVVNRVRSPKHEFDVAGVEERSGIPVFARLRDDLGLARASFEKKPLSLLDPSSSFSREIHNFSSALCGSPEQPGGFFSRLFPFKKLFGREVVNRELLREQFYR